MDTSLSDEEQTLRGPPELTREEKRNLQHRARDMGLWGIDTPKEFGGADLNQTMLAISTMELGRTFVYFRFLGIGIDSVNLMQLNEEQRARFIERALDGDLVVSFAVTEPHSGSDASQMTTSAVQDGDEWVITGEKTWISFADQADVAFVYARTPEDGPESITSFIVERERGWTSSPIPVMGTESPGSIFLDHVRVPDENRISPVGEGFKLAMKNIHRARAFAGTARNIGASERLLELAIEYARSRVTFGKPLAERQAIQWMIADSDAEIRAAKLLVLHAASQADRKGDYRHNAEVAKLFVANTVNRVVDRVMQIHGAMGLSKEFQIQRWYRNLRVERIYEGSDEMCRNAIQRNLFRGFAIPGELG
jgi:acyl-CoA dehydrogenase